MELEINSTACIDSISRSLNPLEALIEQEDPTLQELMSLEKIEDLVNEVSDNFYKKLITHQQLLKDLMDCALRPESLEIDNMPLAWPYEAVNFLSKQQEQFNKSFFNFSKSEETHSDSGSKTEGSELLDWLFKILEMPKPINETSAGYLLRLCTKIYYDNQQEFFMYFANNPEIVSSFTEHLYSPSITELLWKIVDTYNDDLDNKVSLLQKIFEAGFGAHTYQVQTLQNIQTLIQNMIDRTSQMNTKKQSVALCTEIISLQTINLIHDCISRSQAHKQVIKILTIILGSLLKFFIQQKNPKKSALMMASSVEIVIPSEDLIDQIAKVVRKLFIIWFKKYPSQKNPQSKYQAISLLHCILKVSSRTAEALIYERFIDLAILLFKNQPNNNILHNEIKGILEISFDTDAANRIVTQNLLEFILNEFNQQKQPSYLNQLYYISKMIICNPFPETLKQKQIYSKWEAFVSGKYQDKKVKYQTVLAKETQSKKQFFTWQSQVKSEQGEESSEVISVKKYSEDDQNNKILQGLKASTISIEQYDEIEPEIIMQIKDEEPLFQNQNIDTVSQEFIEEKAKQDQIVPY